MERHEKVPVRSQCRLLATLYGARRTQMLILICANDNVVALSVA